MLNLDKLCIHVMKLLHAPVRGYDAAGLREMFKGDDDVNDPLSCDAAFEAMLLKKGSVRNPVFYIEKGSALYIVVREESGRTFVAGPVCCSDNPAEAAAETVKLHNMDKNYPYKMARADMNTIYECALMLFEAVSDRALTREQMLMQNFDIKKIDTSVDKNTMQIFAQYRDSGAVHNPYSQEQREQESIRNGDIEGLRRSIDEVYNGELGRMAKSSLRSIKNIGITVLALASRSAIAGGVLPEIAFSLSDAYAMKIEEMTTEAEIEVVVRTAEFHFANLVRENSEKNKSNPIIMACKDYVLKHINKKITLQEIAAAIDVNASYLSDLFSKQEGITLTEYIAREKVNFAKRQLMYTDESYGEIAYQYAFSSQSHFGRVFKKYTGMTPKEYREKYKTVE